MSNKVGKPKRPTQGELEKYRAQVAKFQYKAGKNNNKAKVLCRFWDFMKTAVVVGFIGLFFYLSIRELSGKATSADIVINLLSKVEFSASIVVAASGVIYGKRQRKLREDHIKSTGPYIERLETLLNIDREGSKINRAGNTREEDK